MTSCPLVYTPISLPGGWTGRVLAECHDATLLYGSPLRPPTVDEWRDWFALLVADPQRLPGCKTLKYSDTVEVIQARIPVSPGHDADTFDVVCKRTAPIGAVDRMLAALRSSRARRNFDRAMQLLNAGVGTTAPLAFLERRAPRASWLVTEYLANVVDLDTIALTLLPRLDRASARTARTAIVHSLADLLAKLQRAGLHHRDLKASNLLLADWDDAGALPSGARDHPAQRLYVVDLDGLSRRSRWRPAQRWQPLMRLAASLLDYSTFTRSDYARCLQEYFAQSGDDPATWREQFRMLSRGAADYARRSQSRKSQKLDGFSGG